MRGNKGEWSELYTFLKLLGDGVLYAGDEHLERIESVFYPLISIVREENNGQYYLNEQSNIKIENSEGKVLLEISRRRFIEEAKELFDLLINAKGSSFEFHELDDFLKEIRIEKLKSSSENKRDITIVVHDEKTNMKPTLGFSIKSRLGSSSTLLNPGNPTNFIYEIMQNNSLQSLEELMNEVNHLSTRSKIKDRTRIILENNKLNYVTVESPTLEYNLQLIDSLLPSIVGQMLIYYYGGRASSVKELVEILEKENPLDFNQSFDHRFYEYKIKNMLTDIALGMTPQKVWTGQYDATGGYIVVKEDGDIICYHIYNRTEFQNYLLNQTLLDTPSSGRYKFGEIYKDDHKYKYKLNLQIRFK